MTLLLWWQGATGEAAAAEGVPLVPGEPIPLRGTKGHFDFIQVDAGHRRLLASHTGNQSLDLIDLDKRTLIQSIALGAAQSVAVGAGANRYYVAVSEPPQLVIVDAAKLEVMGKVALPGPADLLAFDAGAGLAYVGHDDAKEVWVVDPAGKKIAATVALPGEGPEDVWIDGAAHRAYQAVKMANVVAVIDTRTHAVVKKWSTAPAEGPHGMALIAETGELAIAGANGKLSLLSTQDGHVLASATLAKGVDEIAYDAGSRRLYCASGAGEIDVFAVKSGQLEPLGKVASAPGARSIAVDPKTHTVWVAYVNGDGSFVQPFTAGAARK